MRVVGNYNSVIGGVSQQAPQNRRDGQHEEQINFISNPTRGVARRHPSVFLDTKTFGNQSSSLSAAYEDANHYETRDIAFIINKKNHEFVLGYRKKAQAANSDVPVFFCFDKTNNRFIDVHITGDPIKINALVKGGVSALECIRGYLFIAGNTVPISYYKTEVYQNPHNQEKVLAQVRGGAYGRTYQMIITRAYGYKGYIR